jgi:SpoVK/Ycf46/Vps4 family AAA+-type ATPase
VEHYASSVQHILAELERIHLLVQIQVWRARQVQASGGAFRGLIISEPEVDALLAQPANLPCWATAPGPPSPGEVQAVLDQMAADIARRKTASTRAGLTLRLEELARLFALTPFDLGALLICLAPELDLRYERLYAYLQDDVTKKRPSVDLVLNLLCPSFDAKLAARHRFSPTAPLFEHHLLSLFDDPSHAEPPLLGKYLKVDERVVNYLLDSDELDARLRPYSTHRVPKARLEDLILPADVTRRLTLLARENGERSRGLILYFQGPYGVGKQTTAEALCEDLGVGVLVVDGNRLAGADEGRFETLIRLVRREALLRASAVYWDGFDALLGDDRRARLDMLTRQLEDSRGLTFLAGNTAWEPTDSLHGFHFIRVELPHPNYADRAQLWRRVLNGNTPPRGEGDAETLANKFRLTGGQIQDAAATGRNLARWRDPENGHVTMADLSTACRLQSNRKLATLAQKITPHYAWGDIILPPDRLEQLREICNHVRYRALVYDEWGFNRKLSLGKGLNVLFAGPSGTGKTMAAEIMAGELGLDLYKIDLSTVVSKYIGETEKNLARIFAEAETSNAILFFDEADALLGKRSDVKDAHDRYANLEIAYLLQKMEEYEGITILATNLRQNMDEAFVRRLRFIIEFPFPEEEYRLRIWQGIWPKETPLAQTVDLPFMAKQFKLAGGSIRNIALAAAFLASSHGNVIDMKRLLHATRHEFHKMGRLIAEGEFAPYE